MGCNCERGKFLCPKAEALWQAANAEYAAWQDGKTDAAWDSYEQARSKYHEHMEGASE